MNKILLFLKLPPPLTGATLINKFVAESSTINQQFDVHLIRISYKSKLEDVRVLSVTKFITIIKLYCLLFRELIGFRPDAVYFQISPLGWAFFRDCTYVLMIKLFHRKIIYHMHGKGIIDVINHSNTIKNVYRWVFHESSVICLSESLTIDIQGVFSGKPYIVNNGIPNIISTENLISVKNNIPSILFLSNLIISKGILVLLDVIEICKKTNICFKTFLVGQEADISAQKLIIEIRNRNLENEVFYLGPKYGVDKIRIIQNSDLLIYPTLNDAFPVVILEAMQSGLPVIATREGAIPEIIDDGVSGFLVDKHRPDQIAEKIEILINNPELRESMGVACRKKFLAYYTLDIFEQNMYNVFRSVLEKTTC